MNRPEAIEPVVAELAREQLEECRRFFELGDTKPRRPSRKWCVTGGLPLPDWLVPDVEGFARLLAIAACSAPTQTSHALQFKKLGTAALQGDAAVRPNVWNG